MVKAHDPVTAAPLRRQAVADIAKDGAPATVSFGTVMMILQRPRQDERRGRFRALDIVLWFDRLKSGGEAPIIEVDISKNCA